MVSTGTVVIFLAFISFLIIRFVHRKRKKFFLLPRNLRVLGMLPDALRSLHRFHDKITEVLATNNCNFYFQGPWFTRMEMLATSDPSNIRYIMIRNFSNFPKGPKFSNMFDILGDGIFNSDSELWKSQRKLAQGLIFHPRFHRFLVKTSQDIVDKALVPVLEFLSEKGSVLDLQDVFQRFTFDVTCILVTGYDPRSLSVQFPEVEFSKAMDEAEEAIFYRHIKPESFWKLQRFFGIGQEKKLRKAWETLDYVIDEYISGKRDELASKKSGSREDQEEGVDLLTSYMKETELAGLDRKFLRDTIINLLLAGRDTTSSALTWFFWLVGKNPQVETKIREELQAKIPTEESKNKWHLFNEEETNNLVYLHGALCEALRLYPPVPFQHKACLQPDVLPSGHRVNPKMKIVFSLYAMGRMETIWGKDCLEFTPERWISEAGKVKYEPSYKFLAFNTGPRTCLGKQVAFTQMKAVAAAIIHNYNVQLVEGHPVCPSNSIILHMKYGLHVRISKRWNELA